MEMMLDDSIYRYGSVTVPVIDALPVLDDGSAYANTVGSTATYRISLVQNRWIFVGLKL